MVAEKNAAVAEIHVACSLRNPDRRNRWDHSQPVSLVAAEPPWYAIRMPGGVVGALSYGRTYPDINFLSHISQFFTDMYHQYQIPVILGVVYANSSP
jgi:hypothetical protein